MKIRDEPNEGANEFSICQMKFFEVKPCSVTSCKSSSNWVSLSLRKSNLTGRRVLYNRGKIGRCSDEPPDTSLALCRRGKYCMGGSLSNTLFPILYELRSRM